MSASIASRLRVPRTYREEWRRSAALGLVVALVGFVMVGALGAVVGLFAGAVAARSPRALMLAAVSALLAAAAFTIFEQPLEAAVIPRFPRVHPLGEFAARLAAIFLLGGLAGLGAERIRARRDQSETGSEGPIVSAGTLSTDGERFTRLPTSTVIAVLAAVLLGAVAVWNLGDERWAAIAPAVAIAAITLIVVSLLAERLRALAGRHWLAAMPAPITALGAIRRDHRHMLGGSAWLLAATIVVSLGSFVFWLIATQRVPADDVGLAAALFSGSLFICYVSSLGLQIAVSRYAPDRTQDSATLFAWSLLLRTASAIVGVAILVALAPDSITDGLNTWRPGLAWIVVLLLVVGQAISELVDVRLMVLRRWNLVFLRSLLIAVGRLPFLFWLPEGDDAFYVYVVAMGAFAITGVLFLCFVAQPGWLRLRPLPEHARRAAQFAGVNYLGQLALQAPYFVVPVVVLVRVAAVENARFYLSWGVMSVVYISIQMVGQALLVEGGRGGIDIRRQARVSMQAGVAAATAATGLSFLAGPILAGLYGSAYGPVATLLPLLVAGTIPFAVTTTVLTVARIREQTDVTIAVALGFVIAVLVPTVLLTASGGTTGAAWGWTLGNAGAAVVAVLTARALGAGSRRRQRLEESRS